MPSASSPLQATPPKSLPEPDLALRKLAFLAAVLYLLNFQLSYRYSGALVIANVFPTDHSSLYKSVLSLIPSALLIGSALLMTFARGKRLSYILGFTGIAIAVAEVTLLSAYGLGRTFAAGGAVAEVIYWILLWCIRLLGWIILAAVFSSFRGYLAWNAPLPSRPPLPIPWAYVLIVVSLLVDTIGLWTVG